MSGKDTTNCGHLVIDGNGRCESCLQTVETEYPYPPIPPRPGPTPEEVRAQADSLTAAWEAICERVGKVPPR